MLIRGDFVHTPVLGQLEIAQDYILDVSDTGYVLHFGPASSAESLSIIQSKPAPSVVLIPPGSFVIPSFCDLHLHAPQFLYQGTGLHLPLMEWLNEYAFKAEERMDTDPRLAERVYTRLAERLVEHGTGAVLLFGTIKEETNLILGKCMRKAGIRAFVGKLSMDKNSRPTYIEDSAGASLSAAASFVDKCIALEHSLPIHERLIEPVLTPRFVPTCSENLLQGLGLLANSKNLRVQSHMAESHDQVNWVKRERGIDDINVFDKHGLLTARTIQAHCTFLDTHSLAHVAERGTAIAHCPLSNAYFSAEPFRLREALDNGVKVGLGTDIAGGYDISIVSAMRQAVTVSRMREGARIVAASSSGANVVSQEGQKLSIDWKEALYLATKGGADALGIKSGSFAVGAPFDAQMIKLFDPNASRGVGPIDFLDVDETDMNIRKWTLSLEIVEKWFCLGDVRNRAAMWIQSKSHLE